MRAEPDLTPYLDEIRRCHCGLCNQIGYALSLHHSAQKPREELLAALRSGTHRRVEFAEHIAQAKAQHAADIAQACASGCTERRMAVLIRGYSSTRDSDFWPYGPTAPLRAREFVVGLGLGMTPGRYEARNRAYQEMVDRAEREREAEVERLIEADPRNRCVYFRFRGELCDSHKRLGRCTDECLPGTDRGGAAALPGRGTESARAA